MKQPSKNHIYAIGHDIVGNTFVAIKVGRHMDYIYGMFKGKELTGGHIDDSRFDSWHKEGEQVPFEGHPTKGRIVLVMGDPRVGEVREITGEEAETIIAKLEASTAPANAGTHRQPPTETLKAPITSKKLMRENCPAGRLFSASNG